MERPNEMVKGAHVGYKDLLETEQWFPNVYRILEDNGNRVLMEVVWYRGEIKPTYVALKADLRLTFAEHEDVPVPDFINFTDWQDNSWHNDETASVIKDLENGYNLRLWIYSDEDIKALNESNTLFPDNPYAKYVLCIEDEEGHMTMGRKADTDEDCQTIIAEFIKDWQALIKTEEWC